MTNENDQALTKTDGGIIITNNVQLTTQSNINSNVNNNNINDEKDEKAEKKSNETIKRRHNISISSADSDSSLEIEVNDVVPKVFNLDLDIKEHEDIVHRLQEAQIKSLSDTARVNPSNIEIKNSTDITFGNKTHYHGPVTIQQFLLDEEQKNWNEVHNGVVNEGYMRSMSAINKFPETTHNANPALQQSLPKYRLPDKLKNTYFIGAICCCLIVAMVILITFIMINRNISGKNAPTRIGDGEDSRRNIPINSTIEGDLVNNSSAFRFVTRDEWVAQPPRTELASLELPSTMVIISHTATDNCSTQAQCTFRVRFIQTFHMDSRNWDDIGYNFLVGGDGAVYEGRGWLKEGAHTKGYNKKSIGIAFIGTFIKDIPPLRQIVAAKAIIQEGLKEGYLNKNYKLFGHRQLSSWESPGEALYNIIKTWPHWSSEV